MFYQKLRETDALYRTVDEEAKNLFRNHYANLRIDHLHIGQIPFTILFRPSGGGCDFIHEFRDILASHGCTDLGSDINVHGHFTIHTEGRIQTREFLCIHYKIEDQYENNITYIGRLGQNNVLPGNFIHRLDEILARARVDNAR